MADISALPIPHNIDTGNAPQLARILCGKIETGEYRQGDILPAADLAHEYNVSIRVTYSALAMLYHASERGDEVEDVLNQLVDAAPTPEGYGMAARLWATLGERSRAEALRSDARTRFRGDPSLVLLGRDGRR